MRRLLIGLCTVLTFVACNDSKKTVAIILPVEHAALLDIKDGLVATLKKSHPEYNVVTKNAQGDPNVAHSILSTLHTKKVAYIAPIGVTLTTAAKKLCSGQTIIGLAAYKGLADTSTYIVEDEVGPKTLYQSVIQIFPDIKNITLIHAQDDKIVKEVKEFETLVMKGGRKLQKLPVITTNDLQTVSQHIKGEVVLILKDHTVVSGLDVILKQTKNLNIPLIASDEGSVKKGATYAFGVIEREIGIKGAQILAELIDGKIPDAVKLEPKYLIGQHTPSDLVKRIRERAGTHKVAVV